MGQRTDIQWCDSSVNPTTGCDGCELWELLSKGPCYAGNFHEQRLAKSLPHLYATRFTEVRLAPGRMAKAAAWPDLTGTFRPDKPWLDGMPRTVFVGDMADLFSLAVPFEFIADEVIGAATSAKGARHVWMLLTKRPSRMASFARWLLAERGVDWPGNVWAGTSVTGPKTARRLEQLREVPAAVRFASFEPLRGFINPTGFAPDWLIVGGESRQGDHLGTPFNLEWARRYIRLCRDGGPRVFIKQLGSRPYFGDHRGDVYDDHTFHKFRDGHGGDWSEWPDDLRVRQMPEVAHAG